MDAEATIPSPEIIPADLRAKILQDAYSSLDSAEAIQKKLTRIFEKDCTSYWYREADLDLSAEGLMKTYPPEKLAVFYRQKADSVCSWNLLRASQLLLEQHKADVGTVLHRTINRCAQGSKDGLCELFYSPWNEDSAVLSLIELLGKVCNETSLADFKTLYCLNKANVERRCKMPNILDATKDTVVPNDACTTPLLEKNIVEQYHNGYVDLCKKQSWQPPICH